MKSIQQFLQKPWLCLAITLIGIFLKFYRLESSYFWYDELATIRHTSGIRTDHDFSKVIPVDEIRNISVYRELASLRKQNRPIKEELTGLFSSTNLTPGHYPLLMIWYRVIGDKPVHYRLFSVVIFILTLPLLFLFAKALFRSVLSGWVTISLFAVSPFFHYYAREARFYILWVFLMLLLCYLLLLALRKNKSRWWIIYIIIGIFSMYTSLLSALVLVGHLIYIWILRKEFRLIFIGSLSIIILFYTPWLVSLYLNRDEIYSALSWHDILRQDQNYFELIIFQLLGFTRTCMFPQFYDSFLSSFLNNAILGSPWILLSDGLVIVFVAWCIIYAIRKLPKENLYLILTLIIPQILFFNLTDIFRNSGGSLLWRYHVIDSVAIILFIAYLLAHKISSMKFVYFSLYFVLSMLWIQATIQTTNSRCIYRGSSCHTHIADAELYSESGSLLIITDFAMKRAERGINDMITIFLECNSDSIDVLRASHKTVIPDSLLRQREYSKILVTHASQELVDKLKSQWDEQMDSLDVEGITSMWQIKLI